MKHRLKTGQVYSYTWSNGDEEIHLLLHEMQTEDRRHDERVWQTFRLDSGALGFASFLLDSTPSKWKRLS